MKNIVVFFLSLLFVRCNFNGEDEGRIYLKKRYPHGVLENFTLISTDSAKVRGVLTGKLQRDFSNQDFKYNEFPKGIDAVFYGEGIHTTVVADYAIAYRDTEMLKLEGNVMVKTEDGKILKTPRLYVYQPDDWIFTEDKFSFTNPEEGTIMDGIGIDFLRDFQEVQAHKTTGIVSIEEGKDSN